MEKLIKSMQAEIDCLSNDLTKATTTKAAAARARKSTLELAKLGKQFRKDSVKFHKEK